MHALESRRISTGDKNETETEVIDIRMIEQHKRKPLNKADLAFTVLLALSMMPFIFSKSFYEAYLHFNHAHGLMASFIKFALLATMGELIGLRIKKGHYYEAGFGVLPRAMVWGILGLTIKMAFVVFATGVPLFLAYCGLESATTALAGGLSLEKVCVAFFVSISMNILYAPLMMTFHKITDIHITNNGGTLAALFRPIKLRNILFSMNWDVQWNFVFMKTIPYFWIPAHTITFLLPEDFQVLFAAVLGICLGTILAVAELMDKSSEMAKAA